MSISGLYVWIADEDCCLAIRVIEHLHADRSPSEMRFRAFDDAPNLDTVALPNNIISIEVKGHHLAWLDNLAVKSCKDNAIAIEKRAADRYGAGSGVGCRNPRGLAKSDADGTPVDDEGLRLHRAEGEERQDERAED